MKKWVLEINSKTTEFVNFKDAVTKMKDEIFNHIKTNEDVFWSEGMPFAAEAFFSWKYDDGTITDEDIVVDTRTNMLCRSFIWKDAENSKENVLLSLRKSIHYYFENTLFQRKLIINIDLLSNEVKMDISHYERNNEETYMRSNAFIFDDASKEYYFKSHQIINSSDKKEDLGKQININILLKEVE